MAITFVVGEFPKKYDREGFLLFEPELRKYFRDVGARREIPLAELAALDPYGDIRFEGDRLVRLEREVETLLSILEELYRGTVPLPFEPPNLIGLESEPEGKPCGREGVLRFLRDLKNLSRKTREEGLALWALGD